MSRKKRILFLSEASYLSTGYATYSREVLKRLNQTNKYVVAELSIYGKQDDERRKTIPWKNYPNLPSTEEEQKFYGSSVLNQFGSWRFERACLDFKPDCILDIRDFWMSSFVKNSPYRRIYNWLWMPTVDAQPQNPEWLAYFADCDGLLTYSNWAKDLLEKCSGNKLKPNYAPPSASSCFRPSPNKEMSKELLGINPSHQIIGTVMRNQRRKLYPDLFKAFSKFIYENNNTDVYLYCHTSYPDNGWDFAPLLMEYDIASRVYFTYMCKCGHVEARKFNDVMQQCPKCRNFSLVTSHVNAGLDEEYLAKVYQSFDLYAQIANSEGFGIPVVEAAACGIPICCVDYSAMEDFPETLGAYPIESTLYNELETGCYRAIPDPEVLASYFKEFFNSPVPLRLIKGKTTADNFSKNYSWDKTTSVWESMIDSLPYADWTIPPAILQKPLSLPKVKSNSELINWLFSVSSVDGRMMYSYEHLSLLRDISNGMMKKGTCGYFIPESSVFDSENYHPISQEHLLQLANNRIDTINFWEKARAGLVELKEEAWLK